VVWCVFCCLILFFRIGFFFGFILKKN